MFNIPYTQKIFKNNGYSIIDTYTPYAKAYLKDYGEAYHIVLFIDNYAGFLKSKKNVELLKEQVLDDLQSHFYEKDIYVLVVMKAGTDSYLGISEMDNVVIINPKGKCIINGDIDKCFTEEMKIIKLSKKIGYKIQKIDRIEGKTYEDYGAFGVCLLIAINVYMFMTTYGKYSNYSIGVVETIVNQNIGSLVIYMFCHNSIGHLISNCLYLFLLGRYVENTLGIFKTYIIYILGGIYAGIFSCIYKVYVHDISITVGASGAIFAILGAYSILSVLYSENKRSAVLKISAYAAVLIAMGFLNPMTDNICHIGGFISGILITIFIIITEETIENIKITQLIRSKMKAEKKIHG